MVLPRVSCMQGTKIPFGERGGKFFRAFEAEGLSDILCAGR